MLVDETSMPANKLLCSKELESLDKNTRFAPTKRTRIKSLSWSVGEHSIRWPTEVSGLVLADEYSHTESSNHQSTATLF